MVPQGIRPVVQLTAVEVNAQSSNIVCLKMHMPCLSQYLLFVCVCADSCMGPEKHEAIPAGCSVLTQPGGRVWWADGGVSRDQEYEKEPKLPQLCPVYQSGTTGLCKWHKHLLHEYLNSFLIWYWFPNSHLLSQFPSSCFQRMRCTHLLLWSRWLITAHLAGSLWWASAPSLVWRSSDVTRISSLQKEQWLPKVRQIKKNYSESQKAFLCYFISIQWL